MSRKKQSQVSESERAARVIELSIRDLLQDCPFVGALALGLELYEDYTCDTAWTDGVRYGYNPKFVLSLTRVQVKGLSAHEVFHVMLQHPWRRRGRNPEWWNEACDYAINLILVESRFVLPGGALLNPDFKGLPAEIIYRKLFSNKVPPPPSKPQHANGQSDSENGNEDQQQGHSASQPGEQSQGNEDGQGTSSSDQQGQQQGQSGQDGQGTQEGDGDSASSGKPGSGKPTGNGDGNGEPMPGSGNPGKPAMWGEVRDAPANMDPATLQTKWAQAAERARTIAMARGNMPGHFEAIVKAAQEPLVDWKEVLWHLVEQCRSPRDYSWRRPNANYMRMGLYVPTLSGEQMPPMVFVKDTSGSVDKEVIGQFHTEMVDINASLEPETMYIVDADARVAKAIEVYAGDDIPETAFGRGGTDYRPAFEWVEKQGILPSVLIYAGDMDAVFPQEEPDYEVIWVMTTHKEPPVPWGHRLRLPL